MLVIACWALKSEGWCRCSSDQRFCPRLSAAGSSFAESVDGRRARGRLFPAAWAIPARDDLTWFTLASNLQCLQRALQRHDAGLIALYCRRRMGAAAAAQISTVATRLLVSTTVGHPSLLHSRNARCFGVWSSQLSRAGLAPSPRFHFSRSS